MKSQLKSALASLSCLFWLSEVAPVGAQQSPQGGTSQAAKPPDKLVIDADQLIYDKDKNTVSAVGSVQLFYQGRILQADRVVYNRATKRVYAEGHAKMTDEHGDVVYGSRFELSDNFREGFIDSVQVLTSDKTRFTAPRVERTNGDVTATTDGAATGISVSRSAGSGGVSMSGNLTTNPSSPHNVSTSIPVLSRILAAAAIAQGA